MKSPIGNDLLKLSIEGQAETQLFLNSLFKVLERELQNIMASIQEDCGLKEARYADNNIIISDSTLRNILLPQLNNMTYQ